MKVARRHGSQPGFMLAPMIDMTFLLLIFFMLTSKISKEQIKLDVRLPVAANSVIPNDLSDRDIINIDSNGQYYVGNNPLSKEDLDKYLRQRFKDFPPLRIYVRADRNTPAKKIKELMQMAGDAGAIDVIFGSYQKD